MSPFTPRNVRTILAAAVLLDLAAIGIARTDQHKPTTIGAFTNGKRTGKLIHPPIEPL